MAESVDWMEQRSRMVERQLRSRGIRDQRVLAAMLSVPREEFVPPSLRARSYNDEPLKISHGQSISQPYIIALMSQSLELDGTGIVLEVGAGSGYHAAVLSHLAARIVAVERIPELARTARENLKRAGYSQTVTVVEGDGSRGWPDGAPYRAISVAAAAPEIPWQLLDQLADPGRLVIPVGSRDDQDLKVVVKANGKLTTRVATFCRFVPLLGAQGWS